MPRKHKVGAYGKKRQKYSEADVQNALSSIQRNGLSVNGALEKFKIPRATLQRYLKKIKIDSNISLEGCVSSVNICKLGRKSALSKTEEKVLADLLGVCANWGYPFQLYDLQILVRDYLNDKSKENKSFGNIFKDNLPGEDWARGFIIYLDIVLSINDTTVGMKFLWKKKVEPLNTIFCFPNVDDIDTIDMSCILSQVKLVSEKRGHMHSGILIKIVSNDKNLNLRVIT